MRIGIVCPYSLTLPGGVQGQVLALARALRTRGHDVRVLGPCDGPPPDSGVTPLGDSLPTAANGSVAPIAPDPSAQLRTIRALRDERFDVVNVHEPLAPGVTNTALLFKSQPIVGTFHAAGESAAYRWLQPVVRWLARKIDVRCAVSADARDMAIEAVGGSYELLFNGVDLSHYAGPAIPKAEPRTILFLGRHEPRKGLAVLLEAMGELPAGVRLVVASDGPETEELRRRVAGDTRIEWLGRISEAERSKGFALRRFSVRPRSVGNHLVSYCSRLWLPKPLSSPATSPATPMWREPIKTHFSSRQEIQRFSQGHCDEFSTKRLCVNRLWPRAQSEQRDSPWTTLRNATKRSSSVLHFAGSIALSSFPIEGFV